MSGARFAPAVLCAVAVVVSTSCGDLLAPPSRPHSPPRADIVGSLIGGTGLLTCAPIPGDSVTQSIGPLGGVISVGPHRLRIPAGALSAPVAITAVAPSDIVNRIRFQPEGLTFDRPAWLTMSYANCDGLGAFVPPRIAYTTDALVILEYLLSFPSFWSRTVTAQVDHFSTYAVAW